MPRGEARPLGCAPLVAIPLVAVLTCGTALWAGGAGDGVLGSSGPMFAVLVAGIALPPVALVVAVVAQARDGAAGWARLLGAICVVLLVIIVAAVAAEGI